MNFRPYIAIFLIAAILNPFCCCTLAAKESKEVAQVSSCPHCPPPAEEIPADELPELPGGCCVDRQYTQDADETEIDHPQLAAYPAFACEQTDLPRRSRLQSFAKLSAVPVFLDDPPLRVRLCTYLL